MSERTLEQISQVATEHYGDHVFYAGSLGITPGDEWVQQDYDKNIAASKEFAEANASQLYDLAVLDASIGGVAINVKQPESQAEHIEVRKDNS